MNIKNITATMITAMGILAFTQVHASPIPVFTGTYADMFLKQNTFPSGLSEEQVFLDAALSSSITGHVGSQNDSRLVTFSSTTDVLDAANGFATIKAQDGLINQITITAPGYWFEDLIFSVNLTTAQGVKPNSNTDLVVTATDKSGGTDSYASWATQGNWVNGQNDIMVLSTAGNLMQSVTITSQYGMQAIGGLDQLKQTQISGLTPVPVPAAAWLFASGLLGLVGVARRRS
jgi:hypothetical protein